MFNNQLLTKVLKISRPHSETWEEFDVFTNTQDQIIASFVEFKLQNPIMSVIESKILHLTKKYGRGSIVVHFNSLRDYKSREIASIKELIKLENHPALFYAIKDMDDSIIINDKMIWLPMKWIDLYLTIPSDSASRYHPLCCYFSTIAVIYYKWSRYNNANHYQCVLTPNFNLHSDYSFECRYKAFLLSSMKFKQFKNSFPIFYKQLLDANKIKKYPIDLRHFSWQLIGLYVKEKRCDIVNDHKQYIDYYKKQKIFDSSILYNKLRNIDVDILEEVLINNKWYNSTTLQLLKAIGLLAIKIGEEWILNELVMLYYQLYALKKIMIILYGSKCDYCSKIVESRKLEKYKKCANCKQTYYCCRKCQKTDWNMKHRKCCAAYQAITSCFDSIIKNSIY